MAKKKGAKRKMNPLSIERQDTVREVRTTSTEMVRLSRVKYEGNDYHFVDIRRFWRGWGEAGEEVFHPSAKGIQIKESDFIRLIETYLDQAGKSLARDESGVH